MRYIFWGTPEFAAIILEKLIDAGMPPVALVCNPDKPSGRKMVVTPPPTKELIIKKGWSGKIDILQPENIEPNFINQLKSYEADFYLVAAYGKILPPEILKIPRLGVIGVHPSLLPKLRGPSPIQSAILEGLTETGVTLFLMDEKVDHGPILNYAIYPMLSPHTYNDLSQILARLAGNLLVKTLPDFVAGKLVAEEQNDAAATFTAKFATEDGYINPEDLKKALTGDFRMASFIDRKIKALNPEPGVYTFSKGKRVKLLSSKVEEGKLILEVIQFEGKNPVALSSLQQSSLFNEL